MFGDMLTLDLLVVQIVTVIACLLDGSGYPILLGCRVQKLRSSGNLNQAEFILALPHGM